MSAEMQRTVVRLLGVIFGIVGFVAMAVCAVFSLSSDMIDVVGAGLGLVTGAVLMGSGLISLAVVSAPRDGRT